MLKRAGAEGIITYAALHVAQLLGRLGGGGSTDHRRDEPGRGGRRRIRGGVRRQVHPDVALPVPQPRPAAQRRLGHGRELEGDRLVRVKLDISPARSRSRSERQAVERRRSVNPVEIDTDACPAGGRGVYEYLAWGQHVVLLYSREGSGACGGCASGRDRYGAGVGTEQSDVPGEGCSLAGRRGQSAPVPRYRLRDSQPQQRPLGRPTSRSVRLARRLRRRQKPKPMLCSGRGVVRAVRERQGGWPWSWRSPWP